MTFYWPNAIIYSENGFTPLFHQASYEGCLTLKKAKEAVEIWKEIYPEKMICSWIEKTQEGRTGRKICFQNYVNSMGKIDYDLPGKIKKYRRKK